MKCLAYFLLFLFILQLHLCNGDSSSESEEVQRRTGKNDHPCELECKQVTNPRRRVCGSDGITYPSFCLLKAARCRRTNVKFVSRGACPDTTPSETTIWTSTSSTTTSHPAVPSRFVEKCPDVCPLARQPVCGTDGTTYQSPCILQLVACIRKDHTLVVVSLGPCPLPSST